MRTKNKIKDFEVESRERWEVADEYFTKEFEKNLVRHRADERLLRYKLEVYQKNFPNFVCGSPTSTKASDKDEEAQARPGGIAY